MLDYFGIKRCILLINVLELYYHTELNPRAPKLNNTIHGIPITHRWDLVFNEI
ncbi:protein of unknown function [Candidatus Nitrosocosmicus franklandus]|uniref:Uncharacterized protein n=1 Tax=Candidatus Nitrosocosmicus franklandianus TaxID=1798806 RepID=A0A484IA60_9ARCH|nr:protein of unknown function [Candidatus Nitrosocosmicus franklandus]